MPDHTEPRTFGSVLRRFERDYPGWTLRCNPGAVPGRRWTAQTVEPLTAAEMASGYKSNVLGPDIETVQRRLSHELEALARWERGQREGWGEWLWEDWDMPVIRPEWDE